MSRLILLLGLFLQGGGQPINLPVTSANWKFGNGTGPYGMNGCYSGYNTGKCTQDLGKSPADVQGVNPAITGFYTLTFDVVNRYPSYPSYFEYEIDFGTQELCSGDGWATGALTQITKVCPSSPYLIIDRQLPGGGPPQGKQHLVLSFSVGYWLGLSDNYSVTFTPQQ